MKLNYFTSDFIEWIQPQKVLGDEVLPIDFVSIDSRSLFGAKNGCFIALKGSFRSGEDFVEAAYQQNIRVFLITRIPSTVHTDAVYLLVKDTLQALQLIASKHRQSITYPIVAIAGKNGKTTVKEWLYEIVKSVFQVVRSPKSYNSQLGVPLSLLALSNNATLGIIEVGLSKPTEFEVLYQIINPTHLIVTSFFQDPIINQELQKFLATTPNAFTGEDYPSRGDDVFLLDEQFAKDALFKVAFKDQVSIKSVAIAAGFAKYLGLPSKEIAEHVSTLRRLALRLETFNGKNNTIVVNDTYNLDLDAFRFSLEYLSSFDRGRPHCIYVGLDKNSMDKRTQLEALIEPYKPDHVFIDLPENLPSSFPEGSVVLLKGTRKAGMERFAANLREQQHQTTLEINLSALRNNLVRFKNLIHPGVNLLAMVKSQSYGSGLQRLAAFLEVQGVDYFGVAFTSEGVALRKHGIKKPILVLNPDPESYSECIAYQLEPTIFTFTQLDLFIRVLIELDINRYPIHVEVDTGMRRLGFEPNEIKSLLAVCQAQPEIYIKGVFSHFVESEETENRAFSLAQIERFQTVIQLVKSQISHDLLCHMANSEGIVNYPEAHFNMVRLGLGMYGLTNSILKHQLDPVLAWKSVVSQVKWVNESESVSYARSFIAKHDMKIAIIPLGYGDGFSRALSNGQGGVNIHGTWCPTVGMICMDMMMVDVSMLSEVKEGDEVVVFDDISSLERLSKQMNTIPYEVMTGISDRVHRVYFTE
ncbi:MAG: alanine racemase [Flavobacteriales bacterium]